MKTTDNNDGLLCFQVFDICKNADPGDPKPLKMAEKLKVKLTAEEKELAGKPLLKVNTFVCLVVDLNNLSCAVVLVEKFLPKC